MQDGGGSDEGGGRDAWGRVVERWAEGEAWRPARGGRSLPRGVAGTTAPGERQLYASANGDRWHLVRDPASGAAFVRHEANAASGGRVTDIAIPAFLAAGQGPEQQELLRLIGTLAEDPPPA